MYTYIYTYMRTYTYPGPQAPKRIESLGLSTPAVSICVCNTCGNRKASDFGEQHNILYTTPLLLPCAAVCCSASQRVASISSTKLLELLHAISTHNKNNTKIGFLGQSADSDKITTGVYSTQPGVSHKRKKGKIICM